ncbi:MAG: hypothetical protein JWR02_1250 [Mucilaginibacter sp.]|nr:hypothetical protein [Mucilaginibacter sp.]
MKSILTGSYKYGMVIVMLTISIQLKAQNKPDQNIPDSVTQKLAERLGVSNEKAKQVQAAYGYKHDEIDRLMKDQARKPADKQRVLKRLMAERRQKIDSVLTVPQKETLKQSQGDLIQRETDRRNKLMQQHETEVNRIPHQQVLKSNNADSTGKKVKTQKN